MEKSIYQKLADARKIIKDTDVTKTGKNKFSNYDYFTPEQVEHLVADASEKTKTLCTTNLRADEFGYYQELQFIDLENTDNFLTFQMRTDVPEIKATNRTQQLGGMDTYSERYIKMKVFQIKDNNLDFDSQDNRKKENRTQNDIDDLDLG